MSSRYFHAIAVDFDGTLADAGAVSVDVLDSLRQVRDAGICVVLVTGRILEELRLVRPDIDGEVDAIVAENGGVVSKGARTRTTAHPIDRRLAEALSRAGIVCRAGEVLLACSGADEPTVLSEIRRLGLDCQLVRNRGELMVLPAGVSKAAGLIESLAEFGISPHNTVGIGDAENDESLLGVCELSVAVANAVEALKEQADIVLDEPDGAGIAGFLRGPIVSGAERRRSDRFSLLLGTDDAGSEVRLAASQLNLLITGGSGEGKSYLAGLIAEQLVALRYSLLVLDPEGDFVGLDELPGTVRIDADRGLLPVAVVTRLIVGLGLSIVLDFSGVDGKIRSRYLAALGPEIAAIRQATGIPQWVIVDEAHENVGGDGVLGSFFTPGDSGRCLVTWRPQSLSDEANSSIDAVLVTSGPAQPESTLALTAAIVGVASEEFPHKILESRGRALLAERGRPPVAFTIGTRKTPHFRHEHKYGLVGLDERRRFYLRLGQDATTGTSLGNLDELEAALQTSPDSVLCHHCPRHDFSRWVAEVFRDEQLAAAISRVENVVAPNSEPQVIEAAREDLLAALRARHLKRGASR